jgi:thymidylate synthase (FAD)
MQIDLYNNKGYVRVIDHMGNDSSFTRAARASFAKDSLEWNEKENKLLNFLIKNGHMSVFRHACITFQIKAPLFVARQHWKYSVASAHLEDQHGWNEMSKRYVTEDNNYYVPNMHQWRSAPDNKKQGSGISMDERLGTEASKDLEKLIEIGQGLYDQWLSYGMAPEQARLFLPAYGLMIGYQWTVSVANLIHFLQERLAHDAQLEMQQLAIAIRDLTEPIFPATIAALELCNG